MSADRVVEALAALEAAEDRGLVAPTPREQTVMRALPVLLRLVRLHEVDCPLPNCPALGDLAEAVLG
jgi:hypothetical protein